MYLNKFDSLNQSVNFSEELAELLQQPVQARRPIIFLCVGSMKCTGDSLAPRIGSHLLANNIENVFGYQTIPVHAKNIHDTIQSIYNTYSNPFVVAIDASIGHTVGQVILRDTPLQPGSGCGKDLGEVGDITIAGTVTTHHHELALCFVAHSLVDRMAKFITDSIHKAINNLNQRSVHYGIE